MRIVGAFFFLELLLGVLFAVVAFQFTAWYRRKRVERKQGGPPPGFVRTQEVHIDPTTGVQQRVWYNSRTGERFYESMPSDQKD